MQYKKIIYGVLVTKPRNQIIIEKDGVQIINPSHELLIENGWEEVVSPIHTDEDVLSEAIASKKEEIIKYDSSDSVNVFMIGEVKMWLDKATRAGLMLRFSAEKATGKEMTSLWHGKVMYELDLATAVQMLYALEVYASQCYDNTQRHLAEVEKLESIADVESYDFTIGYPDMLTF